MANTRSSLSLALLVAFLGVVSACNYNSFYFDCSYQGRTTLPGGVPGDVQVMDLGGNGLSQLSAGDFSTWTQIQSLYLYNNRLTLLATDVFNGLSNVTNLDLSSNQISLIQTGAFNGLVILEELHLYNNKLRIIPFVGLSTLKVLNVYSNQIARVDAHIFAGLSSLNRLMLSDNRISTVAANAWDGLSALLDLDAFGNHAFDKCVPSVTRLPPSAQIFYSPTCCGTVGPASSTPKCQINKPHRH